MEHIYHSHTTYCSHAKMTVEELILKAISEGFKTIGISEHIFSEAGDLTFALHNEEHAKAYVKEVNHFKEVYKDKIRVLCGFELEMSDAHTGNVPLELNKKVLSWPGVDYGLWAFHWYEPDKHVFATRPSIKEINKFFECVEIAFKNGCTYMAHPDGIVEGNGRWDKRMKRVSKKLIHLAAKHNVILGMNVNGYYQQKKYPSREFWSMVSEIKAPMTIELDAHSVNPFNHSYITEVEEITALLGLKPIAKIW